MSEARLAFTYARRELRGGLKGFRVFIACLVLGVAAIASVGSVSSALLEGLASEGQSILGGDVSLQLVHRQASDDERAYLEAAVGGGGALSEVAEMRAMARASDGGERTLVDLKAVDGAYPLYGAVTLAPAQDLDAALAKRRGVWGAVVEETLLRRLDVSVGERIRIGELDVEIRGLIVREPDRVSGGLALGSRVIMSREALFETGLVQLGSLIEWDYRVRLPAEQQSMAAVGAWVAQLKTDLPDAGWRVRDRSNSAPSVARAVKRVALFLTLVGLTALVVGGVGVGNAVKSYLDHKREVIATFKCLGAPGSLVFQIYLAQVMLLAAGSIVIGLVIGAVVPFLVQVTLGDLLPVPARFALYWPPLILAAGYGLLAALAFAIWPLARARETPGASLFRDLVTPARRWPRPAYVVATGIALAGLAALAIGLTEERLFALWFLVGAAAAFAILRLTALGLMALARRAGRPRLPSVRIALANLYRPGAPTPSVVLSLGLGLTLLVAISQIDGNISRQVASELPDNAPSFFFLDIQPDQVTGFDEIVESTDGVSALQRVPMLRGRISAVNGVPADQLNVDPSVRWALQGDRGLTYQRDIPEGSTVVAGEWWDAAHDGPALISLSADIARGFGVGVGDTLTVNVLGRNITGTIANLREINWQGLGINFTIVFSPGVLDRAPQTHLATVTMSEAAELDLQRAVTDAFPNVTAVRVKDALEAVNSLLEDLVLAVRATSGVTLLAGVLVLAGAMAAGHRHRVYDAVVLKVLGATRARVLGSYLIEYALLGLGTAVIAAGAGTLAAYLVITQVMEAQWQFLPVTMALTVGGATLATIALGLAGTWQTLGTKAAPVLRSE